MATRSGYKAGSYYSYSARRSLRQEEVAAYRRIALATVLIVGLLVGGYFLGIPLLARLGSFDQAEIQQAAVNDNIPPATPKINTIPEAVKAKTLTLSGSAESGSTITVKVNGQVSTTTVADTDGLFTASISLVGGENTIEVDATDAAGNVSMATRSVSVIYDAKAPELTVATPTEGQVISGTSVTVTGRTETDATVEVNGRQVVVQSNGTFSTILPVTAETNSISVIATDKAGNVAEVTRSISQPARQASPSAATQ